MVRCVHIKYVFLQQCALLYGGLTTSGLEGQRVVMGLFSSSLTRVRLSSGDLILGRGDGEEGKGERWGGSFLGVTCKEKRGCG